MDAAVQRPFLVMEQANGDLPPIRILNLIAENISKELLALIEYALSRTHVKLNH
jgi:hypothetical protein